MEPPRPSGIGGCPCTAAPSRHSVGNESIRQHKLTSPASTWCMKGRPSPGPPFIAAGAGSGGIKPGTDARTVRTSYWLLGTPAAVPIRACCSLRQPCHQQVNGSDNSAPKERKRSQPRRPLAGSTPPAPTALLSEVRIPSIHARSPLADDSATLVILQPWSKGNICGSAQRLVRD